MYKYLNICSNEQTWPYLVYFDNICAACERKGVLKEKTSIAKN